MTSKVAFATNMDGGKVLPPGSLSAQSIIASEREERESRVLFSLSPCAPPSLLDAENSLIRLSLCLGAMEVTGSEAVTELTHPLESACSSQVACG